jgi:hypothetical protein
MRPTRVVAGSVCDLHAHPSRHSSCCSCTRRFFALTSVCCGLPHAPAPESTVGRPLLLPRCVWRVTRDLQHGACHSCDGSYSRHSSLAATRCAGEFAPAASCPAAASARSLFHRSAKCSSSSSSSSSGNQLICISSSSFSRSFFLPVQQR